MRTSRQEAISNNIFCRYQAGEHLGLDQVPWSTPLSLRLRPLLNSGALESDSRPKNPDELGPRVSKWLGKMASKAASGAWSVALATAPELLTRAIASYYGF